MSEYLASFHIRLVWSTMPQGINNTDYGLFILGVDYAMKNEMAKNTECVLVTSTKRHDRRG